MKKIVKIILLLVIICPIVIWGLALAKCEILTLLHGNEFADVYKENTMLGDMECWKVMDYSQSNARVYYISQNNSSADILTFTNENGKWKYESWDTMWSTSGNADRVTFPYWWHIFYVYRPFSY